MNNSLVYLGVLLFLGIASTNAGGSSVKDCAAQDLRLVTAIEEQGNAAAIPADRLVAAYHSVLLARAACRLGQISEALRMYEDIGLSSQNASKAE